MTRNTKSLARKIVFDGVATGLRPVIRLTEACLRWMRSTYRRLTGSEAPAAPCVPAGRTPAVPVELSVTPDYIVCLEDGRRFKMLKGHLRAAWDMTPDQYRAKWGLPADYPMVAPNYREKRAEMARQMDLGHLRKPKAGTRGQGDREAA